VILAPVVSENSFRLARARQYRFVVALPATASTVAHAIEQLFSVHVQSVRTLNRHGKRTRTRGVAGRRTSVKHALVTVRPGESIAGFDVATEPTTATSSAASATSTTATSTQSTKPARSRRRSTPSAEPSVPKESR
jgi:large subunit ribosomal protein L23